MPVDTITFHLEELNQFARLIENNLISAAENNEEFHNNEKVTLLTSSFVELLETLGHSDEFRKEYLSASRLVSGDNMEMNTATLEDALRKFANKRPQLDKSLKMKLQEFKQCIWDINHSENEVMAIDGEEVDDEDEDVVVSSTVQSLICPLTRKQYCDPVTNQRCGHSYSREAINALEIRTCPISGCNQELSRSTLRPNVDLARRIERRNRRRIFPN